MPPNSKSSNDRLVIVLSIAFVLGMAVALGLILLWRSHPTEITQAVAWRAAVALCPPFMLVGVVGGVSDTTLTLVLTTGTIVFANGSLYAGFAAFAFWALSSFWPKSGPRQPG